MKPHPVHKELVRTLAAQANWEVAFEELVRPLHEGLYQAQGFEYLDRLTPLQQLTLSTDYIRMQVGQGGFIQLLQNGYAPLLVTAIESAQKLGMGAVIRKSLDDVLKVFVLNHQALSRETNTAEFAQLYDEFKEFEALEKSFSEELPGLLREIVKASIQAFDAEENSAKN